MPRRFVACVSSGGASSSRPHVETGPKGSLMAKVRTIARQPIFDNSNKTVAYELLFRPGSDNPMDFPDGDIATKNVIDSVFLMGLETLSDNRPAFINCTRNILVGDFASLLPKEKVVLEVLENIEPDEEVVRTCRSLKSAGYKIALDDFTAAQEEQPLVALADYIKVDFMQTTSAEQKTMAQRFRKLGIHPLAEKVETHEEVLHARDAGYELIQGFFFAKPHLIAGNDIAPFKLNLLRILQEVNRPDFDLDRITETIKPEASVCFRLLRYLNSFAFGFRREIGSLRHGLALLGQNEIQRWVSVVTATTMAQDKPSELMVTCLIRAHCCELLAPYSGLHNRDTDLFLCGLFSLVDALLDRPLASILSEIPIALEITSALLDYSGPFRPMLDAVLAMERGDFDRINEMAHKLSIDESVLSEAYLNSISWAQQIYSI